MSKVLTGKLALKPCHITSTNLHSLEALLDVINAIGVEDITEVLSLFKDDFELVFYSNIMQYFKYKNTVVNKLMKNCI